MAKTSKATRKFQSKHLKHTLDHRREVQKQNKKFAQRRGNNGKSAEPKEPKEKKSTKPIFDDMSVEDFFEGGFEVPKPKKGVVINENDDEESEEEQSESENGDEDEIDEDEIDEIESESEQENEPKGDSDSDSSDEDDEETMKADMAKLAEEDPEFYDYLAKNDKKLLDFEAVNPMDAMSEEEEEEDEEISSKKEISKKLVAEWDQQLKEPTAKTIQTVVNVFASVVGQSDSEYRFSDPSVLSDMMFVGLKSVPAAVQKMVPYKKVKGARVVNKKSPNYNHVSSSVRTQANAYVSLLRDITNTETAALVLASVQEMVPFYVEQRKVLRQLVEATANVWATTADTDTQIATYAFMNNVAREFPDAALDPVLRSSYSALVKFSRKTTVHNMDQINFCKNSAAELFGIDQSLSYQVGFEYVRQLAMHLRTSISSSGHVTATSGKDAYKQIYNWQFCHSLDFWSRVLAVHCNPEAELALKAAESPLRSLIYPLVQVTLGAIKLIPTAQFFALRFYLVRSLLRLSRGSGVFIPLFPLLAEILTSSAFTKPPKAAALPAVDFDHTIKVSSQYLGTRVYLDGLCEQFVDLTSEYLVLYAKNVAFPELVTPVVLALRRFVKKSKNFKFNKSLQQLVEKLNANSTYIQTRRNKLEYGPSNKAEVNNFLKEVSWESTPLGQYVVVHRKAKEQKARMLKEAQKEETKDEEMEELA